MPTLGLYPLFGKSNRVSSFLKKSLEYWDGALLRECIISSTMVDILEVMYRVIPGMLELVEVTDETSKGVRYPKHHFDLCEPVPMVYL